jgi:hypothetical protein
MRRGSIIVAVAGVLLGAGWASASAPIFSYNFPASWSGTGTVIVDQSTAHNDGKTNGALALSAAVPPGAPAGTQSITTNTGAIVTNATSLLTNPVIAAAGGFEYDVAFRWDGTTTRFGVQKIIDYAGTDSLQLDTISGTTANLDFIFTTQGVSPAPDTTVGPLIPIVANTWYQVSAKFDTLGNGISPVDGSLPGLAELTVTPAGGLPVMADLAVAKTTYGDSLARPIGVGELGSPFGFLVNFNGQIFNPSVTVPEPTSIALIAVGAPLLMRRQRKSRI